MRDWQARRGTRFMKLHGEDDRVGVSVPHCDPKEKRVCIAVPVADLEEFAADQGLGKLDAEVERQLLLTRERFEALRTEVDKLHAALVADPRAIFLEQPGPADEAEPTTPADYERALTRAHEAEDAHAQGQRDLAAANAQNIELRRLLATRVEADRLSEANARIAELEARLVIGPRNSDEVKIYIEEGIKVETEVARHERDAANARAEELTEKCYKSAQLLLEANARADAEGKERERLADELARVIARADAAERALKEQCSRKMGYQDRAHKAEAERDQLAARVTELESELDHARQIVGGQPCVHEANQCTPEERKVLEACEAIPESELRSSGNWFGWAKPIGDAVRANRAAKAQREAK